MNYAKQHISSFTRFLVALIGIALYSILLLGTESFENHFSHLVPLETEYYSVNGDNSSSDEDSNHSNNIFDLVFKETVEEKEPSANTSAPALLKQGVKTIEVAIVKLSLDNSFLYKRTRKLPTEYTPYLKNQPAHNFFVSLLPLAGGISINAP